MVKVFFLVLLVGLSGCVSLGQHFDSNGHVPPGVYPGLRSDVKFLTKDVFSQRGGMDALLDSVEPFLIPVALVDIPLSFGMDTLLLPVDVFKSVGKKDDKTAD